MVELVFPTPAKHRGVAYWLRPHNLWVSRRKLKTDHSNEWRYALEVTNPPNPSRSGTFESLLGTARDHFRFIILGDTGEGDRSQYGLLPLVRAANPDFLLINGDVAYPAGRHEDFIHGFFEPHKGLGIPIWATAGNHEYYSKHHGREFHDIYCTRKHGAEWARFGLRFVPQPGMFWELRDPSRRTDLTIIGLDSGKTGNLDGHNGLLSRLNPFERRKHPDMEQHAWLDRRLSAADQRADKAIVLFHIPGLVSQEHAKSTHLNQLHRILARHPSVRMVVCGHIHNHQQYLPTTFEAYSSQQHGATRPVHEPPHYVVSGHGGATIDGPVFKASSYPVRAAYPSLRQWKEYSSLGQRIVDASGLDKSLISRTFGRLKASAARDGDAARLLSFLMVDVEPGRARVSHVHMDDLQDLFSRQPDGTRVYVDSINPPLDPDALARTSQHLFDL